MPDAPKAARPLRWTVCSDRAAFAAPLPRALTVLSTVMRALLLSLISSLVATSCVEAPQCRNALKLEAASPNGKLSAAVFERDCGESIGPTTHVSITRNGWQPSDELGNVFRGRLHPSQPSVIVRWKDNDALIVVVETSAFKQANLTNVSWGPGEVSISYAPEDS